MFLGLTIIAASLIYAFATGFDWATFDKFQGPVGIGLGVGTFLFFQGLLFGRRGRA